MIARTWRGRATAEKADDYHRHFLDTVAANLGSKPGHRGAYLLRREVDGDVEFLAVALWDSIETIKSFAGDDVSVAHIEPEGRAALSEFDEFALNFEVAFDTITKSSLP